MKSTALLFALVIALCPGPTWGAQAFKYPPQMEGARAEVYKEVGGEKLKLYLFEPAAGAKTNRPAIVFFFGGGWTNGSPSQFEKQCRYLAARGFVAITADYRVGSRQQVKPTACVADAKSALRWVRANAARLGLDPQRIAAGGGSAGGHLAAAVATLTDFDEPGEDRQISCRPNACVLFNPALVLAPLSGLDLKSSGERTSAERFGTAPEKISPAHHVTSGTAPTLLLHGKADTTVPFATAEAYSRVMRAAGNRCDLVGYEGQGHGFFNANRAGGKYAETVAAMDQFFVSLGWLKPEVNDRR